MNTACGGRPLSLAVRNPASKFVVAPGSQNPPRSPSEDRGSILRAGLAGGTWVAGHPQSSKTCLLHGLKFAMTLSIVVWSGSVGLPCRASRAGESDEPDGNGELKWKGTWDLGMKDRSPNKQAYKTRLSALRGRCVGLGQANRTPCVFWGFAFANRHLRQLVSVSDRWIAREGLKAKKTAQAIRI